MDRAIDDARALKAEAADAKERDDRLLGRAIRLGRERRGIAQDALAEAMSTTRSMLSQYENGRVPVSEEVIARAAGAMRTTPFRMIAALVDEVRAAEKKTGGSKKRA